MTLTEIQNRIRTKRDEIAAEVRSYDAQTSVQNSWRADRQRLLDWLDGLLEGETSDDVARELNELRALVNDICDLYGIGGDARTPWIILANVQNSKRRSECLGRIEWEFFTTTKVDEDGEEYEDCPLNWGANSTEYAQQFASALRQVAQEKERETLERAAKVCRERAAKHRETSEKAAFHTLAWVDGRALEATCCANEILRLSPTAPSEGKHQWDGDGERCLKCGDKDWFAGPVCKGKAIPTPTEDVPTPTELVDGYVRVPMALLDACKTNLQVYRSHTDGEYRGGMEHRALIDWIERIAAEKGE